MGNSVFVGRLDKVRLVTAVAACIALVGAGLIATASADAAIRKGPKGAAFYKPPKKLLKGTHGKLVWQRNATGAVKPSGAAWTKRVLYLTKNFRTGKPGPVSGTVSVPKGTAPEGGWPLVTWGHGTTGIADKCAPSKVKKLTTDYIGYQEASINAFLKAGYAVAQTDYEGLGTAGVHPYLVGASEGRSMLDIVPAARRVSAKIGSKYAALGHSQGGHAALFAADEAGNGYLPDNLTLVGTVGYAPAARLYDQAQVLLSADETTPLFGQPSSLSGLIAMIVRGASVARPGEISAREVFKGKAKQLVPKIDTLCSPELGSAEYYGGIAPYQMLNTDSPDIAALEEALQEEMSPSGVDSPAPFLILHGSNDTTVLPLLTGLLVNDMAAGGSTVDLQEFTGLTHGSIVTDDDPKAAALAFLDARF